MNLLITFSRNGFVKRMSKNSENCTSQFLGAQGNVLRLIDQFQQQPKTQRYSTYSDCDKEKQTLGKLV